MPSSSTAATSRMDRPDALAAYERLQCAPARCTHGIRLNGAAQESNLPSIGLRRRTGFEVQAGLAQPALLAALREKPREK
jgi:hypothetical protein